MASSLPRASRLFRDAHQRVKKWDYPPVALPAKEYMERAKQMWEEMGLPQLKPKSPWHGYELGHWPEELREAAAAVVGGRDPAEAKKSS